MEYQRFTKVSKKHYKIIQRKIPKKYRKKNLKKDTYLQRKDKQLLII